MNAVENNFESDIGIITQLMAAQSMLYVLPDEVKLGEFVTQALKNIAAVESCSVCIRGSKQIIGDPSEEAQKTVEAMNQASDGEGHLEVTLPVRENMMIFTLQTSEYTYGYLFLFVNSDAISENVKSTITNFINVITIDLERRRQKEELERYRDHLGKQVQIRTANLYDEIAGRIKVEHALVESESRFRRLFEQAEVSIWNEDLTKVVQILEQLRNEGVTDLDKHLRDNPDVAVDIARSVKVKHVNEATLKLFGAKTEEEFLSRIDTTFGPDAVEIFIEELCTIWDGKNVFRAEAEFLAFDGRRITGVISFRIPVRAEDFASVPVTILDITDRKKTEKALQESEARFRQLFEKTDAISVQGYDSSRRVIHWNPASEKLYGYSAEEAMGRQLEDLIVPDIMREEVKSAVTAWMDDGPAIPSSELTLRKADGSPVHVFSSHVMFRNLNNELELYCIDIDLSERKRAQHELKEKEEIMIAQSRHAAMGEMIGMIAHQWRQPITVIAMGANNTLIDIELEEVNEEGLKEQAQSILEQTEYLSKTIDDFRNFFRPDKEMEEVRLQEVMAEAEKIIGKSLEYNGVTLSIRYESACKIKTYSRELLQVYINLLKNAKEVFVDNRQSDRHIDVVISDDEQSAITTICDNGGGIDETIIEKIFDPYFSTKDEKTGTGLGLYMSKTIVEKHLQGTIEVSNINDGACFTIKIPIDRKE